MKKFHKKKIKKITSKNKKKGVSKSNVVIKKPTAVTITTSPVPIPTALVEETKPKKPKSVVYFTNDTEQAITEYNQEENQEKRETIYNTRIKFPFEKLVENVFNTFKFSYFDVGSLDVQKETLSHLVANMSKYDSAKGKAFSYFSIVAKHYLIFHNNSNYKRFIQQVDISEENEENTVRLQTTDRSHKKRESDEFMRMMIDYWDTNLTKIFTKNRDLGIAQAVVELFRNSDRIDAFNKKALYLYIREISSCKTQQITKVINKMKVYQDQITKSYINTGTL